MKHLNPDERGRDAYIRRVSKRNRALPEILFLGETLDDHQLDKIESQTLLDTLRELLHVEGQYHKISRIVRFLVTRRQHKPDAFLYECLIGANIDPKHGSVQVVENLLREMDEMGIMPTATAYQAALEVSSPFRETLHPY